MGEWYEDVFPGKARELEVAELIQRAKAEAWDEGEKAGHSNYRVDEWLDPESDRITNPYREA